MKGTRRKNCRHCKELFQAEARNRRHQRYCCKEDCQRASKSASQRRWLNRAENRDYFRGALNVERVRQWRARNPGYWRRGQGKGSVSESTLQEVKVGQVAEKKEESGSLIKLPLQDVISEQPLILIGLIANIMGTTLQEDIAFASKNLLRLGQDIVNGIHGREARPGCEGGDHAKTTYLPRTGEMCPPAIQLGGSASGA